jgi:cytoskeletal protein RodZ
MTPKKTALRLEEHRLKKGVKLEQIANNTKISTRFLTAIESEEFEKLPGGVFDINYIRQYAAAVSYPADRVLASYAAFDKARQESEGNFLGPRRAFPMRWVDWLRSTAAIPRS